MPFPERVSLAGRFGRPSGLLIGVVHLPPLPGTARAPGLAAEAMRLVLDRALADAGALEAGGMHGLIVENFGDVPFHKDQVPAAIIAALARVASEVRRAVRIPLGVNVLRNDAGAALAVAVACGLDFIRVNVHAGAMLTDQGPIEGRSAHTLAERRRLGAGDVLILADVLVKHATPLAGTREALLPQVAEDTFRRGLADALIVSGAGTGKATLLEDVAIVRRAVPEALVLVGSGVTDETVRATLDVGHGLPGAHGAIVGTWLKRDGRVDQSVDVERVRRLVAAAGAGETPGSGLTAASVSSSARARAKTD